MNELLNLNIEALQKQLNWLLHSHELCKNISLNPPYQIESFDKLENLSSRYVRSIDESEFETQGTLIDVVNRAHKRRLFESMDNFRKRQMIRNEIVHQYIDDALPPMFPDLLDTTPLLISIIKNTLKYAEKMS